MKTSLIKGMLHRMRGTAANNSLTASTYFSLFTFTAFPFSADRDSFSATYITTR